tara:strand:- start:5992 stop:7029 length:1038 start_codon:yes stop_codon:yes gene_type:complete
MRVEEKIKSQILSNKKEMRLDKFISHALFNKDGYYYNKKPIGLKYDFITSPEISQMFGEIIGTYLFYMWQKKINSRFNFIELGPGKGTLFKDIVNTVSNFSSFLTQAKIKFVEINEELIKIQKNTISKYKFKDVKWYKNINFRSNAPSIIYSNEFFDCFPVRQFVLNKMWYEKYVDFNQKEEKFYFKDKIVTNKNLLNLLNFYKKERLLEVSFERNKYFEKICKLVKKNGGLFLTVDYGYVKSIANFTLQAIQNHKFSHVLENVGEKDISSHVNFDELIKIAKKNNLRIEEFTSQRIFLTKYGIIERNKRLSNKDNHKTIDNELNKLIDKKNMGNLFKILVVSSF